MQMNLSPKKTVSRDHLSMHSGVVFQGRFYCIFLFYLLLLMVTNRSYVILLQVKMNSFLSGTTLCVYLPRTDWVVALLECIIISRTPSYVCYTTRYGRPTIWRRYRTSPLLSTTATYWGIYCKCQQQPHTGGYTVSVGNSNILGDIL